METKIETIKSKHKKLEEKYSTLLTSINKEKETVTPPTSSTDDNEIIFNIPTSNGFQALSHHESNSEIETMTDDTGAANNHQHATQQSLQNTSQQDSQQETSQQETSPDASQHASQHTYQQAPQQDSQQPRSQQARSQQDYHQASQLTSQEVSHNTLPPKSHQTETTKIKNSKENQPNNSQTIILCDSNGRFLKPEILCPDSATKYIRCPTLSKAEDLLNEEKLDNPKTFIVHTGTNDLEQQHSNQHLLLKYKNIIKTIKD